MYQAAEPSRDRPGPQPPEEVKRPVVNRYELRQTVNGKGCQDEAKLKRHVFALRVYLRLGHTVKLSIASR